MDYLCFIVSRFKARFLVVPPRESCILNYIIFLCHNLMLFLTVILFVEWQPLVSQDMCIVVTSRSRSDTPHSVEFLWRSDQLHAENCTWQHKALKTDIHATPLSLPAGFENASPTCERLQSYALDRAAIFLHNIPFLLSFWKRWG
jgi:hypothetical protein